MSEKNIKPRILVPIANGGEEIETAALVDVLARAECEVVIASVGKDRNVKLSRGLSVQASNTIEDVINETFEMIALPGGMPGAENLRKCEALCNMLKKQASRKGFIAAICASPAVVLAQIGLLKNVQATCYDAPPFRQTLEKNGVIQPTNNLRVSMDKNFITSVGPGSAIEFSLVCVAALCGSDTAKKIAAQLMCSDEVIDSLTF